MAAPAAAIRWPRPSAEAMLGVADAQGGVTGVDDLSAPGLRVGHGERADVGQGQLADRAPRPHHIVAAGEGAQRVVPTVGTRKSETTTTRPRRRAWRRNVVSAFARSALAPSSGGCRSAARMAPTCCRPLRAGNDAWPPVVVSAPTRLPPRRPAARRRRRPPSHVVLLAAGGAEGQAGRVVDQQPQLQLVVGDGSRT